MKIMNYIEKLAHFKKKSKSKSSNPKKTLDV